MSEPTEPKKLNVVHIGPGGLALGCVLPSMDRDAVNLTVLTRPLKKESKKESEKIKKLLHEQKQYFLRVKGSSAPATAIVIDSVMFDNEVPRGFWNDVDVLTVSVGIDGLDQVAEVLVPQLRRDNPQQELCILAFENGGHPSTKLYNLIRDKVATLERGGNVKACDVAIDSMCKRAYETENGKEAVVAYAQASPSVIVLAPGDTSASKIRRVFGRAGNGFEVVEEPSKKKRIDYFGLIEHKKAWFVNAPDYIIAAYSIKKQESSFMVVDDDIRAKVKDFGRIAEKELRLRCRKADIPEERIVGEKSFLGTCSERIDATLANIVAEGQRDCYGSVLKNLGVHKSILTYFDESGTYDFQLAEKENALSKTLSNLIGIAENHACKEVASVLQAEGDRAPSSQEARFPLDIDGKRMMLKELAGFYAEVNVASYLQKVRERLVVLLSDPTPVSAFGYNRGAVGEGDKPGQREVYAPVSLLLQLIDMQLEVAADALNKSSRAARCAGLTVGATPR